ncbi:MAG: hypothetical protein WAX89_00425 [Alphaproteobacteria bacterium]
MVWILPTFSQLLLAFTIAAIGTLLLGAGSVLGGKRALEQGSALWLGWGLLTLIATLGGAAGVPLSITYLPIAGLGLWGLWLHRGQLQGWGALLLVGTPVLVLAAMSHVVMWDDFAHRLGSAKFLWEHNAFPRPDLPASVSGLPGYPYGLSFIDHAASLLLGQYVETAMAAFGGLQVLVFGWLVAQVVGVNGLWARAAAAVLVGVVLNPLFINHLVFSGYNDTSTALATAVVLVLVWQFWPSLTKPQAPRTLWQNSLCIGLAACVVVGQKQVAILLPALIGLGVLLEALRHNLWRKPQLWQAMLGVGALPVLLFGVWQWYVKTYIPAGDLPINPPNWYLWQGVLSGMGKQAWENPHLFMGHIVLILLAIENHFRPFTHASLRTLLHMTLPLMLGYTALMWLAYLVTFSPFEATNAASFERYSQHVAWASWLVCLLAFIPWLQRRAVFVRFPRATAYACMALAIAAPILLQPVWLVQAPQGTVAMRQIAEQLRAQLPANAKLMLYDPQGHGYAHTILEYDLGARMLNNRLVSSFHPVPATGLPALLNEHRVTHVLILSQDAHLNNIIAPLPPVGQVTLLERPGLAWVDIAMPQK